MCCCVKRVASICPSRQQAQASAPSSNFCFRKESIHSGFTCGRGSPLSYASQHWPIYSILILEYFRHFSVPECAFSWPDALPATCGNVRAMSNYLGEPGEKAFDLLEFQSRMLKANQPQKFFHFLAVEDTASRPVSRDVQDSFFFKKRRLDGVMPVNSETSEMERHMSFCSPSSDASCMKTLWLFLRLRETTISVYGRGSRLLLPF